jgi:hypothetical protein
MSKVFHALKRRLVVALLLAALALPVSLAQAETAPAPLDGAAGIDASWNSGPVASAQPDASWSNQPSSLVGSCASWNSGPQPR